MLYNLTGAKLQKKTDKYVEKLTQFAQFKKKL